MILRKSLKNQINEAIWELIITGEIAPNTPLREVHLSDILNVSRTPLREALQQLKWEGILTSEQGKGFRLSKFSVQEVQEIYPLRAKLESFALELSGIPSKKDIQELTKINHKILKSTSSKKIVELDEKWHNLLIANCNNKKLLHMIKILHRQSQRYEYAYMNMNNTVEVSVKQHEKIIDLLQKGNLNDACSLFAENNMVGVASLTEWVKSINSK